MLSPDVLFTRGDVNDRPKLWTLLQEVDCVYHLAARVSVPESMLYPREYNAVNVGGTVSLMEAMRDVGVRRVVFISSGAVYGDQGEQPLQRERRAQPALALCRLQAGCRILRTHDRRLCGASRPSACASSMPMGRASTCRLPTRPVIPNFLRQALRGSTLVMHGDGSQTRDYVYVDDVVSAMISAATAPGINHLVINVGSGSETSIRDLVRLVMEVTGVKGRRHRQPAHRPGRLAHVRRPEPGARKTGLPAAHLRCPEGLRLTLERDSHFRKTWRPAGCRILMRPTALLTYLLTTRHVSSSTS